MNRYLVQFSYIGTNFRGVPKLIDRTKNYDGNDNLTIAGAIEQAIGNRMKPVNDFYVLTSSRTDSGVHALNTAAHVDLERKNGHPYDPIYMTCQLNRYFDQSNVNIRVHKTELVSKEFHARRSVQYRKYVYRLAVAKTLYTEGRSNHIEISSQFVPIEERNRCHFITNRNFDIDKAIEVAPLFVGCHDFRTFMNTSGSSKSKCAFFAKRNIDELKIIPMIPLTVHNKNERANNQSDFNYWNIEFKAKSFVYRQIRKIVGTLIAVAEGRLTKRDIYEMLTIPSQNSWKHCINLAPARGLYLTNVEYGNCKK